MARSAEWQFQLWPVKLAIGIRTAALEEALRASDHAGPSDALDGPKLLGDHPSSGVSLQPARSELLVWEYEGGNLG